MEVSSSQHPHRGGPGYGVIYVVTPVADQSVGVSATAAFQVDATTSCLNEDVPRKWSLHPQSAITNLRVGTRLGAAFEADGPAGFDRDVTVNRPGSGR